ncbi:MAG TPA: hypothetical protein VGB18_02585 [Candidatus Thermoplasmatota archaeon]
MKYIDERRMRFGYIGLFVLSAGLIGAAFWDYTYNDEALLNWFVSALGGLLLIAIFFFIATELILKDALDLRPRRIAVATDEDHGVMPAQHQVPSRAAAKAAMPADAAASSMMMDRPAPNMQRPSVDPASGRGAEWRPHVQPPTTKPSGKKEILKIDVPKVGPKTENVPATKKEALKIDGPTRDAVQAEKNKLSERLERAKIDMPKRTPLMDKPKSEQIRIAMPETQFINAKPKEATLAEVMPESPAGVPKPKHVQAAPHGVHLQTIAYELGSSQFRVPRGSKGHRNPNAVLESTRVLCGDCGLYFRVDLDRARPMSVQCPQCSKDLGLSGAKLDAEHIKMRCRFCGDFLQMPRASEHKATQCATCGQING